MPCFSCFSPSIKKIDDTATVVTTLSIDAGVAEMREDAPPTADDLDFSLGFPLEFPLRNKQGRFSKIRSMSDSVKKGVLAATPKKGALATTPTIGALVDTTQWNEKPVIILNSTFVGALNARVKKNRRFRSMSASVSKVALAATQKKGAPSDVVQSRMTRTTKAGPKPGSKSTSEKISLLLYEYFLIILSGHNSTDYMVRLPYDRNTTFLDLRREIEEDYGKDFPFSEFKFTITAEGMAVSRVQERKWRVCDYNSTKQRSDGTYNHPHHLYVKSIEKESKKMEEEEAKEEEVKEEKNNEKVKIKVRWSGVDGEKKEEVE
jgi:hypothetical protein